MGFAYFSGVTDVIGGRSPIPGMGVRDALQALNPNRLIVEIPGADDQGQALALVYVPIELQCPTGTKQFGGGG